MVTLSPAEWEELTPEEQRAHQAQEDRIVFGHDFQRDRNGNPIEVGVGSPGNPSINSLAAIRKWEGEDSYQKAVADIWQRDPEKAKKLGLPQRRVSK
jgi:hypothetical protein